jgi:hypothetical protein
VFTNDGHTYAGQCRDGHACGLGMATWPDWSKTYAEHGRNGKFDGRCLRRYDDGDTDYGLYERGEPKDFAHVSANGTCMYNYLACAPDDPRLLALIVLVAPVEVRPAAPAPAAHHPPATRPQAIVRWISRLVLPRRRWRPPWPRRTPSLVVARHDPTAAALRSTSAQRRVHATDLP